MIEAWDAVRAAVLRDAGSVVRYRCPILRDAARPCPMMRDHARLCVVVRGGAHRFFSSKTGGRVERVAPEAHRGIRGK